MIDRERKKEILVKKIIDIKGCLEVARVHLKMANDNLEFLNKSIEATINNFENLDDFIDLIDNLDDYKELFTAKILEFKAKD